MVKHTQTIRRLLPTNCLSVFDHFVGLLLKGLMFFFVFSPEEAGRYLETYKSYEFKPPDVLQEKVEADHLSKVVYFIILTISVPISDEGRKLT